MTGLAIILVYVILAFAGPFAVPRDPFKQNLNQALLGMSWEHPLGTDELGRDMLSRVLYGGRLTLQIVMVTVLPSAALGSLVGLLTGFSGSIVDLIIMRAIDTLMAFPGLLLALAIVSVLGPSLENMIIAIAIYMIPGFVRVTRGATLRVKNSDYIMAAKALGCTPQRILLRHVLLNCMTPIIVHVTLEMGAVVLMSSGLSFLGLGVQRPTPEWGLMLSDGRQSLRSAPHVPLVPGVAIMFLVLGLNLLGDGLRDVLDPTSRPV
jgi:peptide/nickel transport system permease protein